MRSALVIALCAGCAGECEEPESQCGHSGVRYECYEGAFGSRVGCCPTGSACVDTVDDAGLRRAACSVSGAPDPRCAGMGGTLCIGNTLLVCDRGFVEREEACDSVCVTDQDHQSRCVVAATDARCAALDGGRTTLCDGEWLLQCRGEMLVSERSCPGVGASCGVLGAGNAFCVIGSGPDPRCVDGPFMLCDGNMLIDCIADHATARQVCDPATPCHATRFTAWCDTETCDQ
jgi:hypothetical protein